MHAYTRISNNIRVEAWSFSTSTRAVIHFTIDRPPSRLVQASMGMSRCVSHPETDELLVMLSRYSYSGCSSDFICVSEIKEVVCEIVVLVIKQQKRLPIF